MKVNKILLSLLFITGFSYADVQSNMSEVLLTSELRASEGNKEAAIDLFIKKIDSIGYSTVAVNKHLETHYYNKFQEKNVEMLSFFSLLNKEKIRPLLLSNPDFGAYTPFNFLVYKTLDTGSDNNTWYGHLDSDTMLNIIGENNKDTKKEFKDMVSELDILIKKELKPKLTKRFEHTKPLPVNGLTKFVKKFEATDDIETFMEEFIMEHDGNFAKRNFIIAGFIDMKFEYDDMELAFEKYDAYWISLLCHFEFSNAIFNRGVPEGGMFAPCSVYFYIPKGKNELHVGYASVDNWVNALNFKDQKRIDYMKTIDSQVQSAFEEMGFKKIKKDDSPIVSKITQNVEMEALKLQLAKAKLADLKNKSTVALKHNTLEEAKKVVPTAVITPKKKIVSVPTVSALPKKRFKAHALTIGDAAPKLLSAYYAAQPQTVNMAKENLEKNGFTILAQNEVLKGHTVLTITNPQLQATNTYVATLNVLVDPTNEIRVQNPSYFGSAYLGDSFKYGQFNETLKSLQLALGKMYLVNDIYETEELASFQFMMGLPQFDDTVEVAEGLNLKEKINDEKTKKYVAYTLKLSNGSTLVGHILRNETNKFLDKINVQRNTNLLPYESIIQHHKATILDPKYYLALSLPLLTMSDFMKIASAPEEIENDIKRAYK